MFSTLTNVKNTLAFPGKLCNDFFFLPNDTEDVNLNVSSDQNFVSVEANHDDWVKLKGKFLLNGSPARAVVYIEGPPPGIDVFVDHFEVKPAEKPSPSRRPYIEVDIYIVLLFNMHILRGWVYSSFGFLGLEI